MRADRTGIPRQRTPIAGGHGAGTVTVAVPEQTFLHVSDLVVPVDHAWSALQDPSTWAEIGGVDDIDGATFDDSGNLAGFRFAATVAGRQYPGHARVVSSRRPESMVVDIETRELSGSISVDLAPIDLPDQLSVQLSVSPRSFFAGMMFSVIAGAIGNGFPERVEHFAAGLTGSTDGF